MQIVDTDTRMSNEDIMEELDEYGVLDSISIVDGAVSMADAFVYLTKRHGYHTTISVCESNERPAYITAYCTRGRRCDGLYSPVENVIYVIYPGPLSCLPNPLVEFLSDVAEIFNDACVTITDGIKSWMNQSR